MARSIWAALCPPFYGRQLIKQLVHIGYFSLPVVGLTAAFTGMVLALQSYTGFSRFSAENAIATVVVLSVTRELAPVLAGLMVAGRVGAAMAAEIGTMRVTEQIERVFRHEFLNRGQLEGAGSAGFSSLGSGGAASFFLVASK